MIFNENLSYTTLKVIITNYSPSMLYISKQNKDKQ